MKLENKSLAELEAALQDELKKESPDVKVIGELSAAIKAKAVEEAAMSPSTGPDADELDALREENARLKEQVGSDLAARLNRVNEGETFGVPVEEDGKQYLLEVQVHTPAFVIPGFGRVTVKDIIRNQGKYGQALERMIERESPVLHLVSKKPLKKGGK